MTNSNGKQPQTHSPSRGFRRALLVYLAMIGVVVGTHIVNRPLIVQYLELPAFDDLPATTLVILESLLFSLIILAITGLAFLVFLVLEAIRFARKRHQAVLLPKSFFVVYLIVLPALADMIWRFLEGSLVHSVLRLAPKPVALLVGVFVWLLAIPVIAVLLDRDRTAAAIRNLQPQQRRG